MSLIYSKYFNTFLPVASLAQLVLTLVRLLYRYRTDKDARLWDSCCICDLYVSGDVLQETRILQLQ